MRSISCSATLDALIVLSAFYVTHAASNKKYFSPKEKMMTSTEEERSKASHQVFIPEGDFWMGSQVTISNVLAPAGAGDGGGPRRKMHVNSFYIDADAVTNEQYATFVKSTRYVTEAEIYGWSFVFEATASAATIEACDDDMGRVKDAEYWLAVRHASWKHPQGRDSSFRDVLSYPAVHISYKDAAEYCHWIGRRLPTEKEWEYAARGGVDNITYPWGNKFLSRHMNIWEGEFPVHNTLEDGFLGVCPVHTYPANDYGVYNMLGNVWEWVSGGKPDKRVLRGGSFIDSLDGTFNHMVTVGTRQVTAGDNGGNNIGFRCAKSVHDEGNINEKNGDSVKKEGVL